MFILPILLATIFTGLTFLLASPNKKLKAIRVRVEKSIRKY